MNPSDQLARILMGLHRNWEPHKGQQALGRALFYDGYKDIFADCGRNFGKTDFAIYAAWRWAEQNPGSENYIFQPLQKQAKEIVWAPRRLQAFGPSEWITSANNTEMRLTFNNGSFIKIDGSDNYDSYRGVKPKGLTVYDEFKDIDKRFVDAYEPNRAAFNSPALFLGTPPELDNHFDEIMDMFSADPEAFVIEAPTSCNHRISKEWLSRKRKQYEANGDIETYLREYEAKRIRGGKRSILPQYLALRPKPLAEIWPKDARKWTLYTVFDPGTTTVFGVLFILYNPYSKKFICLDEIYEENQSLMTARAIAEKVLEKLYEFKKMGNDNYIFVYDEAAAWFRNEVYEIRECKSWNLQKTNKAASSKTWGISIIRHLMANGFMEVSDRCVKLDKEIKNYVLDAKGRIPKVWDHLIDDLRYFVDDAGYDLEELQTPKDEDKDTMMRAEAFDEVVLESLRDSAYDEFTEEDML